MLQEVDRVEERRRTQEGCAAGKDAGTGWERQVQQSMTRVESLAAQMLWPRQRIDALRRVADRYPFRVTPYYAGLARRADEEDPILRQFLPDIRELDGRLGNKDPFDESGRMPVPGLVHRFADRVVVIASRRCAVLCRHCTRKHLLGGREEASDRGFLEPILRYLAVHPGVREVIVSGGDPLLLDNETLERLLGRLRAVPHVKVLRVGTRVPVVLPMRIDDGLADLLGRHRPLWVNTQFNHPSEITREAREACERLQLRGIPVSNQAVLLRGINDSVETVVKLCNSLQANMIRPYYMFLCDRVAGTSHFWTDADRAASLAEALRTRVGGLALPKFVADVPGEGGKVQVGGHAASSPWGCGERRGV